MTSRPQRTKRPPVPRTGRGGRPPVPAAPQARQAGPQRIAKLLARAGIASRREIERMIAEGRIALNGEKLTTPAVLVEDVTGITRSEEHTSELQSRRDLVCRLLLEKKKKKNRTE